LEFLLEIAERNKAHRRQAALILQSSALNNKLLPLFPQPDIQLSKQVFEDQWFGKMVVHPCCDA